MIGMFSKKKMDRHHLKFDFFAPPQYECTQDLALHIPTWTATLVLSHLLLYSYGLHIDEQHIYGSMEQNTQTSPFLWSSSTYMTLIDDIISCYYHEASLKAGQVQYSTELFCFIFIPIMDQLCLLIPEIVSISSFVKLYKYIFLFWEWYIILNIPILNYSLMYVCMTREMKFGFEFLHPPFLSLHVFYCIILCILTLIL